MMSPQSFNYEVPADTAQVAKSVFNEDNIYLKIGDNLPNIVADADFSCVYAANVPAATSPQLLALVLVFQLIEGLADDQVVTYTQARIDWKYALHLGLTESGIDPSVFGDFRQRLLNHRAAMKMFNRLMSRLMDLESGFSWNNLNAVNGALKIQRPFI